MCWKFIIYELICGRETIIYDFRNIHAQGRGCSIFELKAKRVSYIVVLLVGETSLYHSLGQNLSIFVLVGGENVIKGYVLENLDFWNYLKEGVNLSPPQWWDFVPREEGGFCPRPKFKINCFIRFCRRVIPPSRYFALKMQFSPAAHFQ